MKTAFFLTFVIVAISSLTGEILDYTLPAEVAYKLDEKDGIPIHLFRLEEDPLDPTSFHAALPTLVVFSIPKEKFKELSSEYEAKTKAEIEVGIRKAQEETGSICIDAVDYIKVDTPRLAGHRVTTKFSFEVDNNKYERISQINLLRIGNTYWIANGISLTKVEHLEKIDKLLNGFTIREQDVELTI